MPETKIYPIEVDDNKTKLINIRGHGAEKMDTYIGSESETYDLDKSLFSNPFSKSEYGREDAVKHFKLYLYRRYFEDKEFRTALHSIEGDTLGCWCYPRRCHGEVIVDLLNIHMESGTEGVIEYMEDRMKNHIDNDDLGTQGFKEFNAAEEAIEEAKEKFDL
jgi:hypothetical protein